MVAALSVYAMKIETFNDSSGNPRRGWLIYGSEGELLGFCKEEAGPRSDLFNVQIELESDYACPVRVIQLGIVEVPIKEYKTACKHDKQF